MLLSQLVCYNTKILCVVSFNQKSSVSILAGLFLNTFQTQYACIWKFCICIKSKEVISNTLFVDFSEGTLCLFHPFKKKPNPMLAHPRCLIIITQSNVWIILSISFLADHLNRFCLIKLIKRSQFRLNHSTLLKYLYQK